MSENPYKDLPPHHFWQSGVALCSPFNMKNIYIKKWGLDPAWNIATAGSCFAQHISRHLKVHGCNVLDMEPPPPGLPESQHSRFGYSMYSCRYGNIYTAPQLMQLVKEAIGIFNPSDIAWMKSDKFYDSQRPGTEPEGFNSIDVLLSHRAHHLSCVRDMLIQMDLFIFTLGLTEAWVHNESGTIYPLSPGTIAGVYDKNKYSFKNFTYQENIDAITNTLELLNEFRKGKQIKLILTVSPVPLTATASGNHVLNATNYSKSTLRSVAGTLSDTYEDIDYFPSYEIITNQAARGLFYEPNLRTVRDQGIDVVMQTFLSEQGLTKDRVTEFNNSPVASFASEKSYIQCEEALLEAFNAVK